ncbi:MAG: TonB-dependent receptor, partial [candidate division KSB1 bacterium]|nr:TonB-dependent receptor [candidate division KSB1 bacterium]
ASFPQRGLRANAALFHYDYNDMQLDTLPAGAPAGAYLIVINAAQATIQGSDVEVLFRPVGNLDVSLGTTVWFTAEFDDFVSVDPNNTTTDPDRSGDRLPQSPELSLNLGLDYKDIIQQFLN